MIHIKDILAWRGQAELFQLAKLLRQVLFVAPSMEVLELLLEMRVNRSHMALVVDEFGGVDGLVTIEDVVEEIVGEIDDEHAEADEPSVVSRGRTGRLDVDARAPVETLDEHFEGAAERGGAGGHRHRRRPGRLRWPGGCRSAAS